MEKDQDLSRRILDWLDSRLGLSSTVLKPVPDYSLNPFYWLGALMVIAFAIQTLTGLLMLLYYIPTTDQAYSSTLFIMKSVPLGQLLETVHLYTAYAMILLAFAHLMRGYFVSAHKNPREGMWIVGMIMGVAVLGFGLTGYLLPWTVVSRSATDVSVGMLSFLPASIGPILKFLIAGTGSDAAELSRFFDLHIVILPATLLILLAIKIYLFEAHGAAKPATGEKPSRDVPWFPNVFVYFAMIGSVFFATILVASAMLPLNLPPAYSASAAANYVPQPEWYFLWTYQLLKFSVFESSGTATALGAVTIIAVILTLLPFIDRKKERHPAVRPVYITLGVIATAELITLTVWGYFTPGQVIPDTEALAIVGGLALTIAFLSWLTFRARRNWRGVRGTGGVALKSMAASLSQRRVTGTFLLILTVASGSTVALVHLVSNFSSNLSVLTFYAGLLIVCLALMGNMVSKLTDAYRRSNAAK